MKFLFILSVCIALAYGQDTSPTKLRMAAKKPPSANVPEGVAVPWKIHNSLLDQSQWAPRPRPYNGYVRRWHWLPTASPPKKSNLPQCKRSDPNLEKCILDGNKAMRVKTNQRVPFINKNLTADSSMNGAKVHAIHTNVVTYGGRNYRIENLKVNFHDKQKYIGHLTLIYPRLHITARYEKWGTKMHFDYFHTYGKFRGTFENVTAVLNCVGSPISKKGVEYLQLDTVTAQVSIGNADLDLKPFDSTPYGQYIAKFARYSPHEALKKEAPVIDEISARLFKQHMNEALIKMPLKDMLVD